MEGIPPDSEALLRSQSHTLHMPTPTVSEAGYAQSERGPEGREARDLGAIMRKDAVPAPIWVRVRGLSSVG